MRKTKCILFLTIPTAFSLAAADDTAARLERAVSALSSMTQPEHGIRPEQIAGADCKAVIPRFKKGAAVIGVGHGRGFVSCRNERSCSAPAAVALKSGSPGVQFGGVAIDIVFLSLDRERRPKLLSDRFTIGSDASAAWGNGKSAHEDPNAKILLFGYPFGVCLRTLDRSGLDQSSISEQRAVPGVVSARGSQLGVDLHGRHHELASRPDVSFWRLQIPA
jgi:lipid-binding SYLF domain-containing protein